MDREVGLWLMTTLLSITTLVGGGFIRWFWNHLDRLTERIDGPDGLSQRVTATETTIRVFLHILGDKAASLIHSPHTPQLDLLLEEYQEGHMPREKLRRLYTMLDDMVHEPLSHDFTEAKRNQMLLLLATVGAKLGVKPK